MGKRKKGSEINRLCVYAKKIEYPGALYHIISRGNYRKELFLKKNTGEAFERCLFEAVQRDGWKLHALRNFPSKRSKIKKV